MICGNPERNVLLRAFSAGNRAMRRGAALQTAELFRVVFLRPRSADLTVCCLAFFIYAETGAGFVTVTGGKIGLLYISHAGLSGYNKYGGMRKKEWEDGGRCWDYMFFLLALALRPRSGCRG